MAVRGIIQKSFRKTKRWLRNYFTLHVETTTLREKTIQRLHFNFEYVLLLISSVIISTLGMLMDSSVIVIGGMLVSPLIIPILSLSLGIYDGNIRIIQRSLVVLVVSAAIILATSIAITELSPLKNITDEITGRANPTLLDLFIALAAGLIGIMASSYRKVADSFAGVAIATSLLPPISAAGIGIALGDGSIFYGGMLLFLLNFLAITFVGTIYLTTQHWLAKDKSHISIKTLSVIGVSLLVLVLPLTYQLRSYTQNLSMQTEVRQHIEAAFLKEHPQSRIDSIEAAMRTNEGVEAAVINTRVTISEGDTVSYQLQQELEKSLEEALHTDVQLQFSVQRSVGILTEEQARAARSTTRFINAFTEALADRHPDVSITTISLDRGESGQLTANIRLAGDPDDAPSQRSIEAIKTLVSDSLPEPANYAISYTPVVTYGTGNSQKAPENQ